VRPVVLASLPWVSGCMEIVPLGIQMGLKANGSLKSPNWNRFIWKLVDTSKIIRNAWWFILVYRMGDNQLSGRRFRRIQHPFSGHALDLDPLVLNLHILGSVFSLMTHHILYLWFSLYPAVVEPLMSLWKHQNLGFFHWLLFMDLNLSIFFLFTDGNVQVLGDFSAV
jgi:hypothetical protein